MEEFTIERVSPMPGQVYQTVEEFDSYDAEIGRFDTLKVDEAHVITSKVAGLAADQFGRPNQKLIIDVDLPAQLIPSSTPGHYHLYIDKEIEYAVWERLIRALSQAGIIEPGYERASLARGFTAVRLPWVKKEDAADRAKNTQPLARCARCSRFAHQINEYVRMAEEEGYESADEAVRKNEGTFNRAVNRFYCTECYIAVGQPLGVAP